MWGRQNNTLEHIILEACPIITSAFFLSIVGQKRTSCFDFFQHKFLNDLIQFIYEKSTNKNSKYRNRKVQMKNYQLNLLARYDYHYIPFCMNDEAYKILPRLNCINIKTFYLRQKKSVSRRLNQMKMRLGQLFCQFSMNDGFIKNG